MIPVQTSVNKDLESTAKAKVNVPLCACAWPASSTLAGELHLMIPVHSMQLASNEAKRPASNQGGIFV